MIKSNRLKYFLGVFVVLALALGFSVPVPVAQADGEVTITVQLQDSDGDLLGDGSLRYHDGSWQTATETETPGVFEVTTSASQVTYEMTYNNGKQTKSNEPVTSDPTVFTTVTVTPALQNSGGDPLSGGTVRFHQLGWQDWGDANTPKELLPGAYTFEMTYNNGRQTYSNEEIADAGGGADTVLFTTVTVTPALKDSSGTALSGGTVRFHQLGWQDWGDANTLKELLPGAYTFEMTFNNGRQTFSNYDVPAGASLEVKFTTVTVTPALQDSDGTALSGGTVRYHQLGWQDWTDANTSKELLPGAYTFEMTYNNGRQTESNHDVPADASHEVLFTTVAVTPALKDSSGTALSGGTVRFHQLGWQDWGDANTLKELLPGAYTFEMTFNNGRQTFSNYDVPAGASLEVKFTTVTVTPALQDSDGTALSGGTVRYHQLGWQDWTDANTSKELLPGAYTFEMTYNNGRQTFSNHNVPAAGDHRVLFTTTTTVVRLATCDDVGHDGGQVRYHQLGWQDFGTTSGGNVTQELLPGDYTFEMTFNNGRQTQSNVGVAGVSQSVPFQTTEVTYQFSDAIQFHQLGWVTFNQPTMHLLPGNYTFKFGTYQTAMPVSGCQQGGGSVLLIWFKDSQGAPVAGGTAHLGVGGWPAMGSTDADGLLFYVHNGLLGNMRVRMDAPNCGGTETSQTQDTTANSVFNFQTSQVVIQLKDSAGNLTDGGAVSAGCGGWPGIGTTGDDGQGTLYHEHFSGDFKYRMSYHGTSQELQQDVSIPFVFQTAKAIIRLEDHSGNPLDGGKVLQGIGGWPQIGTTGDSAPGEMWYELFPGTHTFRMAYNYGTEEKQQDISTPVVFQTGLVELHFSGKIDHGVGGWPTYSGPTEMLPIEHRFRFSSSGHNSIEKRFTPTAGEVFEKSVVIIEFLDHNGNGIDGTAAKYYLGGWKEFAGLTGDDGSGTLLALIDGAVGNLKVKLFHGGSSNQITQHQPTNSYYTFQTVLAEVLFTRSDGATPIENANSVQYYASGWKTFGSGTTDASGKASMELLPNSYKVKLSYGGASNQLTQDIASDPQYHFKTTPAEVLFTKSDGITPIPGADNVQYYASGWKTFGAGTTDASGKASMELLPNSYKVKLAYGGASNQLTQNIATDPQYHFKTTPAEVKFTQSDGTTGIAGAGVQYYASGWKTFGPGITGPDGKASMELLPNSYKVKLSYGGASQQQTQDIGGSEPEYQFQTALVTVKLQTGAGNPISGGTAKYYASGWKNIGSTDGDGEVTVELLPLSYKFSMTYGGATNHVTQDVGVNPLVVFTAQNALPMIKFTDSTGAGIEGALVKYYASGWKEFGTTDVDGEVTKEDLLPGAYKFRLQYGGAAMYVTQDVSSNPVVTFQTKLVTVRLLDKNGDLGNLPAEGAVKYYASGWKTFGTTSNGVVEKELLPVSYKFRMQYGGGVRYITQDVNDDPTVDFQTVAVTVELLDSGSNGLPDGAVKYYASGWKTFGTTGANGAVVLELLPLSYKFRMAYKGGVQYQTKNIAGNPLVTFRTTEVTVSLKTCNGDGVENGAVKYYASGWKELGSTGANGEVKMELLPLSYKFRMAYGGAVNYLTQHVDTDPTVEFTTTTVDFQFGGTIKYYASGWKDFSGPMQMLPANYKFKFGNDYKYVDISGCSITQSVAILKLKDHNGNPIAGATARGGAGSNYGLWHVPGSTDSNGVLFDFHNGTYTTMSYEMRYNNTTAHQTQDITVNPIFEFQTNLVTLRLETQGGVPLDGGNPRYGPGSTYTNWWFPGGETGSSAPGETAAELFPGTYSFQMQYQGTAEAQVSVTIPDSDTTLTWQTTNVTLQYSGQISYGGGSGDSQWFNQPAMELLPGSYTFHFRSCDRTDLAIGSSAIARSFVCARLLDSTGSGLAAGEFKYRFGWGPYTDMGSTGSNGTLLYAIDGLHTNTKFNVAYQGASMEKEQNIASDSFVVFQTVPVTAELVESDGSTGITDGVSFKYRYGWDDKQDFSGPLELLPVSTKMTVYYGGTSVEKEQNVGSSPDFVFQTVPVTAKLVESDGNTEITNSVSFKYRYGWDDKQDFSGLLELLPVSTKMTVYYGGTSVEKEQNVGSSPDFVFQTVPVTAKLVESDGNTEITNSVSFKYRYGWDDKQDFSSPMELLPVSTKMTVYYGGTSVEKEQNVGGNPDFLFLTGIVTSDTCTRYRYGWGTYDVFSSPMELLPVATKFSDADGPDSSATPVAGGSSAVVCQ